MIEFFADRENIKSQGVVKDFENKLYFFRITSRISKFTSRISKLETVNQKRFTVFCSKLEREENEK